MDRGYLDYELFADWTNNNINFVTRLKSNSVYETVRENPIPDGDSNILEDKIIKLRDGNEYRIVTVYNEDHELYLELVTNIFDFDAATIGDIYRDRWEIEVFFRHIKQNLKIKTFVGTSSNAVMIQLWTALTAMLIIAYMKFKSRFGWSLSNLVALFRWNIFTYKDLNQWLDNPFALPPPEPENYQPHLPGFGLGQQNLS